MTRQLSLTIASASLCLFAACGVSSGELEAAHLKEQGAVQLELGSLTSMIDADMEKAKRKLEVDISAATSHNDLDEFARLMRSDLADLGAACDSTTAKLDVLEAFLIRNEVHATALKFEELRANLASKRARIKSAKSEVTQSVSGFRNVKVDVSSREEWQSLTTSVAKGDVLLVGANGSWQIGEFAGACSGQGMSDKAVQPYALDATRPVGALLVRAGKPVIGFGAFALKVADAGGELEARCNDREYLNNRGSMSAHVVAFSPVPSAFK